MNSKTILQSKTFWLNILGLVVTVAEILPPKYAVPTLAIANIAMRVLTNQPVTIPIPFK